MPSPTPDRSTSLTPAQRRRFRKVVRSGLVGLVGLEVLVIALVVAVPRVDATGWPVIDAAVLAATKAVTRALGTTNNKLGDANRELNRIRQETGKIRVHADRNAERLNNQWQPNLDAVTKTPTEKLKGISFANSNPGNALKAVVPGATQWGDYYAEYSASADTVLSTLRSSLDVLYAHNQQIQDDTALERIAELAKDETSRLAMGELKVQSNLEVARQLHALRAQQALETSLYAVTESHRIGTEARSVAEDKYADCRKMSALMTGPLDAAVGTFICTP